MKKLIFFLSIVLSVACDDAVPEVVEEDVVSLVGQTYSGYSHKSIFDGAKMYSGYEFFSADSCFDLLLEEDSRIVSRTRRAYSLDFPHVKIYDDNAAAGYWAGTFSGDYLMIRSLKLVKW